MMPQSPVQPSGKNVPPPADVHGEETGMETGPSDGTSETTGKTTRVTTLVVAHYRHDGLLFRVSQINNP